MAKSSSSNGRRKNKSDGGSRDSESTTKANFDKIAKAAMSREMLAAGLTGGLVHIVNHAVMKAARTLKRDFGEVEHLQVSRKGPADFVSKADQIAERTIYDELLHARPDWGFELEEGGTIEGAPGIKDEDLAVFDCAFKPENGARSIHHMGHIKMMGAVQPFLSGAISKTVNLPQTATVEDIADAYLQAWRLGIKALAIYRDGSKTAQALRTDAQQTRTVESDDGEFVTSERPGRR